MSRLTPAIGRVLLDTNIVIALLTGDGAVVRHLGQAQEVFVPAIVLGELFFGAAKSSRPGENLAIVEEFAAGRRIIGSDVGVAREYGRLKQWLRSRGRPIPENDVWIAATALHYGLTLVSRDAHFSAIEGLATAGWSEI